MGRSAARNPQTLSVQDILKIRQRLLEGDLGKDEFGQLEPLRPDLLESGVARQEVGAGEYRKYRRPSEVAATLFYGIAMNHPFENGNKRTALVSCLVSLDRNSLDLANTSQDELYDMATSIVAHRFPLKARNMSRNGDTEVQSLASWIRRRTSKQSAGDRTLEFRELRRLLESLDCHFEQPRKNFIKIRRGPQSVSTGYPSEHFTVPVGEVKRIRKSLGLSSMRSNEFYNVEASVDAFVAAHRDVLTRLADA